MNATARIAIVVAAALALAASAGGGVPAPSQFVARVDNPWFPLAPGSVYVYRGVKDGRGGARRRDGHAPDEADPGRPMRRRR